MIGLAILLAFALTARLAVLFAGPWQDTGRAMAGDSGRYVELGHNLAAHGVFGVVTPETGPMHTPIAQLRLERGELEPSDANGIRKDAFRTPGYPAFLALCEMLHIPAQGVLLIQSILGATLVIPVFLFARSLLRSDRAALLAAAVVAVHPGEVIQGNLFLSETLYAVALMWSLVLFTRIRNHPAIAGAGGLLLGVATLIRPVSLLLAPPLMVWMLLRKRGTKRIAAAVVLLVASSLPIAIWSARNASIGVGFRLCTNDVFTIFSKNAAYTRMAAHGLNEYPRDWVRVLGEMHSELREEIAPDETVYKAMSRLGWREAREHPAAFARVLADSGVKFMTDHSVPVLYELLGKEYRPTGLRAALTGGTITADASLSAALLPASWMLLNALLALATLAGFVVLLYRSAWHEALLLAGVLAYFMATSQSLGLERMRLPVLGVQAALAAAAFLPLLRPAQHTPITTPAAASNS